MEKITGKAVIAQGGGPTAVINQSLVGAVLQARKYPWIENIYGARHGVRGIIDEDMLDLTQATTHNLEQVALTPSSGMLSTRDKPDEEYCSRIFEVLRAHGVRYFYYIGGNDSADTCRIVNENADAAGYELRVVHIPKTIDNDLLVTDHCPGYGSAAKFVSQAFAGVNLDNWAIPGVYIGVVMGRHAGFLTAASIFGKKYPDDGPHLVYIPERPFDPEKFIGDVDRCYQEFGRCVVAVSEGVCDREGNPVVATLSKTQERDAHGNIQLSGTGALGDALGQLIKDKLKIKRVRCDTFGYLQRSFLGVVSDVDAHEAREVGEKAVQFSVWENVDGSVAIRRTGDYSVEYFLTPLKTVARHSKHMPDAFIDDKNSSVTTAFKNYARPLVGSMPQLERISAPVVSKIINHS
ncbi:MAG: diphosphate--fructose-6-phosphate 1-phosphotransferase [Chitinivibrionales bacterium]|nr:diphosphate--fructose-6-phosphate 1-phosphotransferase [Chitinivibrionales bacterium]MBD3394578.1 diphosphate--fructose-6-phosphate 1-phosphotransferase [Chitinivibrionales bacterium]